MKHQHAPHPAAYYLGRACRDNGQSKHSQRRARRLERPDAPAFYISPKLARQFEEQSLRDLRRDPGDEIVPPDL